MFTQAWFWITLSAFFFNSNFNYYKSKGLLNGTAIAKQDAIAGISMLGMFIFWIIGLFVADHWWQPIAALGIGMVGSSVIGLIFDSILPRSIATALAALSPVISLILVIVVYFIRY